MARAREAQVAAAIALALAVAGCGGSGSSTAARSGARSSESQSTPVASVVAVKWEPAFTAAAGRAAADLDRRSRRIRVEAVESVCHPADPRLANPGRRVLRTEVSERPFAVVVTVLMRAVAQPPGPGGCTPANIAFTQAVTLPRPVGPRALVDGGSPRFAGQPGTMPRIRVPATNPLLERRAEALYGPPDGGVTP